MLKKNSFQVLLASTVTSLILCGSPLASAQTINAVAGQCRVGAFGGDGGPATSAFLSAARSVAFDRAGNYYIADAGNEQVRRVDASGIITIFAGRRNPENRPAGYTGDGGAATLAKLNSPNGVAFDSAGNLYIADEKNHAVRRVAASGIITTIAGNGSPGFSGDGGAATSARLGSPSSVAVDAAGNLYIADSGNYRVRRVGVDGIISTVAGNGISQSRTDGVPAINSSFPSIEDIALDAAGNLHIASFQDGTVRRVGADGIINTVAGGGQGRPIDGGLATAFDVVRIVSITFDQSGNLYLVHKPFSGNDAVLRVNAQGIITRFAGGGSGGAGGSNGDGGAALNASLFAPFGISFSPRGDLYIADSQCVRKVTLNTTPPLPPLSRRGGIDLDGLGKSAVVVNSTAGNQLQAGRLVNNVLQWTNLPGPSVDFRVIAAVDFAGNGKSDLPMLRETPLNANGQGAAQYWPDFNGAAPIFLRDVKPAWDVQAAGDLDGDGLGDLVWRFRGVSPNIDDQGVSYVWFSGTAGTSINQVRKRGGAPLTWTLLGAADLNADGAADMVYVSPTNTMRVLMATPNRTCANLNGGAIPAGFSVLKLADFAGTGRADVLIRNASNGEVRLISFNATGLTLPPYAGAPDDPNASCTASSLAVVQTGFNIATTDVSWTLYATGDFNGDGTFDVIWKRPDNTLTLWLMTTNGGAPTIINNAGTAPANTAPLPLQ